MHWPKKIDTREMLTKETPPNAFLTGTIQLLFFNEHCHCNSVCSRDYKGDREAIPHIHPIP